MQIFSTCGTRTWSSRMMVCSGSLLFHWYTQSLDGTHWLTLLTLLILACSATRMPPFCTSNEFRLSLLIEFINQIFVSVFFYCCTSIKLSTQLEINNFISLSLTGTTEFLVAFIDSSAISVLLSDRLLIDLPMSMLADGLRGCADSFSVIFSIPVGSINLYCL